MLVLEKPLISIFEYMNYRQFLRDYYEAARKVDCSFSQRYIAKKLGMASSGWFADLLKGRTNLAGNHVVKLVELLKLKNNQATYLEVLIQYNQAASIEEKNYYFRRLMAFKEVKVNLVDPEKFEFYSKWYYSAIRELLFFFNFKGNFTALAEKLDPAIKSSQAQEAILLLNKLGFIRKDAQGNYRPQAGTLKKDPNFASLFSANFLKTNMELAMSALEKFQKDERHISSLTLSYSQSAFQKALPEIEALRKKLLALMEEDPHPEKVFQFNLQFFPVTH